MIVNRKNGKDTPLPSDRRSSQFSGNGSVATPNKFLMSPTPHFKLYVSKLFSAVSTPVEIRW